MLEWLRREATRRWLIPVALVCVLVAAFVLGIDNPIYVLLLAPIVATLYALLSFRRDPAHRASAGSDLFLDLRVRVLMEPQRDLKALDRLGP